MLDRKTVEAMRTVWPLEDLKALPTLSVGQDADLKIDQKGVRVWLSRMTVADGAPYDNEVTVEMLVRGGWKTAVTFEAQPRLIDE
jgi:hypothetical protein